MPETASKIPAALILAGGFGTRLRSVITNVPKALAPIAGKPFMALQFEWLVAQGIREIIIAVHYLAEQIIEFAANSEKLGIVVRFVHETEPLGTGGAIVNAFNVLDIGEDILVINGDTLFQFPLAPMLAQHTRNGTVATMTAASGDSPALRHLISKNFSAPRSAPNPASVTT